MTKHNQIHTLDQWFLTGRTCTFWGYEAPKFLGIHALKILNMCCLLLWVQ